MKHTHRLAALLTASLLLLATGCSAAESSSTSTAETSEVTTIPEFSYPDNPLGPDSDLLPTISLDKYPVPENEGTAFIKELSLGWNLGNTFDASDANVADEMDYEKAWCGSITSIQNIAAIKAAGFKTIRIPVSWHNHVDENNKISEPWLRRVKEVVDWCRACDLYVIVNVHHDNDKNNEKFFYPSSENLETSKTYLTAIWTQIAETFKDYDEHLVLEAMNEPRLIGTPYEWTLSPSSDVCKDAVACINTLNQLFVDTVRASGGCNSTRWLMCPGYAASAAGALNDNFVLPTDTAKRVIVSVHAYTPYNFALNATGTDTFSLDNPADTNEILNFMDELYSKFILEGTPVLIGEFGARNKNNLEARVLFSAFYVAAARARGISCVWWDNNAFSGSGENFGLLMRRSSTFTYPEIVQALVKNS